MQTQPARAVQPASTPSPQPILLVSPKPGDATQLQEALTGTRWNVVHARNCQEASELLASRPFPIIIRDQSCCDMGCIHSVRCSAVGTYPAPILIAAQNAETRLWEEVIDRGALEILPKPFERERACKILDFAYRHWLAGDLRRHWERFDYPD